MDEKEKEFVFEAKPEPELSGSIEIVPDTTEFNEPEKVKALIKNLSLSIGDKIREDDDNYYAINPHMVLGGSPPEYYKDSIAALKKVLTKKEISEISRAIKANTKDYNEKLYDRITKRTDGFYWRGKTKTTVPVEIKSALDFLHVGGGLNNLVFHLLNKDKDDFIHCYKCAWKEKPVPDIRNWREINGGEYRVLTDSEADQAAEDYFDDEELWKQAVEAGRTTDSFEDWKEYVINSDGRGSLISGYDGSENEEEIEGVTYYIYRTN